MNYIDIGIGGLLLFGTLLGFIVGARKSFRSLLSAIVIAVGAFLICTIFSEKLINMALSMTPVSGLNSLNDLPAFLANNSNDLTKKLGSAFIENNESGAVLTGFGLSILKLVVFFVIVVTLFLLKFLVSLVLYFITIPFKIASTKKRKKKRLMGAVFGFATSAVISISVTVPIVGLRKTFGKVLTIDELKTALPINVDLMEQFDKSLFIQTVGTTEIKLFDALTSFKVNGKTYSLREELENFAELAIFLSNAGLLKTGATNFDTMGASEIYRTLMQFSDLVKLLEAQKLLKSALPIGVAFACQFSAENCNKFKVQTIDFSALNFQKEGASFSELAGVYKIISTDNYQPPVTNPEPETGENNEPSSIHRADELSQIANIGYGMPSRLSEEGANKAIKYLNGEVDADGNAIPAALRATTMALDDSILLNTIVPNLLYLVYQIIITNVPNKEKFALDDNVQYTLKNELIGIITILKRMVAIEQLTSASNSNAPIDTVLLRASLEELKALPATMIKSLLNIIISGMANSLFASGNTLKYDWSTTNIFDHIDEIITMIELSYKVNNVNKDITQMTDAEITELFDMLNDVNNSELFNTMLPDMITSVAGEAGVPVEGYDYSNYNYSASSSVFTRMKALSEAGPGNRPIEDVVSTATDLAQDPFSLNVCSNSKTLIPTTAAEFLEVSNALTALAGAGTITDLQKQATLKIFAEQVIV